MVELATVKLGPPFVLTHMAAVESHSSTESTYFPPAKGAVPLLAVPELLHNVAEEEVDVPELAAVVVTGAAVVVTGAAVVVTGAAVVVTGAAVVVTGAAVVVGVPELDVEPQG